MNRRRPILPVLSLLLALSAAGPAARGQSSDALRLFDEGTRRLDQGDYAGAVDSYRAVLDEGVASPALYYNMGVAYYRLDRLGEAVRQFERARLLEPGDRLINHNLDIVRSRLSDRITRLPTPIWIRAGQSIVFAFSTMGLFLVGIVAWLIVAGLLVVAIRRGSFEPWVRRGAFAAGAVAVVFLLAAFLASAVPPFGNRSVVVEDSVRLTSSVAGEESLQELHEGMVVDVLETQGTWARVRLPNGVTGWLEVTGLAGI